MRTSGTVDAPIGRHVKERKRISTKTGKARHAVTRWTVKERFGGLTLLEVYPETGRTHQIRVHLAFVGLPVAGDTVYGKMRRKGGIDDPRLRKALEVLKRQALHAAVLGFIHPRSLKYVEFSSPLPADMAEAIKICIGGRRAQGTGDEGVAIIRSFWGGVRGGTFCKKSLPGYSCTSSSRSSRQSTRTGPSL